MLRRTATLFVLLAVLALFVFTVAPATAHHKDGHENGGGQSSERGGQDDDGIPDDDDDNRHPSGKDRETNDGPTDDTQGNSPSDPDDDGRGPDRSNGGPDKPGGSGGVDQDDQDGNNGCGNDDDFEDDNEGWCGGKPKPPEEEVSEEVGALGAVGAVDEEQEVKGEKAVKPAGRVDEAQPEVLGARISRAPAAAVRAAQEVAADVGAALPFTGSGAVAYLLAGLSLVGAGWFLVRRDV